MGEGIPPFLKAVNNSPSLTKRTISFNWEPELAPPYSVAWTRLNYSYTNTLTPLILGGLLTV